MTLNRALATFIYYPLGGSRTGKIRANINLFFTFIVSGLWHGANVPFIVWGFLHGSASVLERIFEKKLERVPRWIRWFCTFIFINFTMVLARTASIAKALSIYHGMLCLGGLRLTQVNDIAYDGIFSYPLPINLLITCGLLLILCLLVFLPKRNSNALTVAFTPTAGRMAFTCALFTISLIHLSRLSIFIYFNF